MSYDYDFLIIGSGFGGSVSAMRLTEKGYRVAVVEKGKKYQPKDFPKSNWDVRRYLWAPLIKCFGIQKLTFFKNVFVLSGVGVGGGSLVYANTLIQPGDLFFESEQWRDLADWRKELDPHYQTAKKMLGVAPNPKLSFVDEAFREIATEMGREQTFKEAQVGVLFGDSSREIPDPYFDGKGPPRRPCTYCGRCMVGCKDGGKNTLDKNYLYFAIQNGAEIYAETEVTDIQPLTDQEGYDVVIRNSTKWFKKDRRKIRARRVILSGGVLGTVDLLLKCKFQTRSLDRLSDRLGDRVRTNSEAIIAATEKNPSPERDYSKGVAITSIFHPDDDTHIEPVRYPRGSTLLKFLAVPLVDGGTKWVPRFIKFFAALLSRPLDLFRVWFGRDWASRTVIFLVMQTIDSSMKLKLRRSWLNPFRRIMTTGSESGDLKVPSYIPVGNQVAKRFAEKHNAFTQSSFNEAVFEVPTTAHILGGCGIGKDSSEGVIDLNHEVFNYPGLYVCDGSAIPANLGVNPSLTITAMTERAMSRIPKQKT